LCLLPRTRCFPAKSGCKSSKIQVQRHPSRFNSQIKGLESTLYAQIQAYAINILGTPIIYDSHSYPYFFYDLNENGEVDPGEAIYPNSYKSFDAALLRTTYNYQFSKKEPHGYIHNSRYIAQLLADSIEHLGGDISAYTWR